MELAFVLLEPPALPAPDAVVRAAGVLGVTLTHTPGGGEDADDGATMSFELPTGATLIAALMPAPHPDAPSMLGPLSPSPDEVARSRAHLIVTVMGLEGDVDQVDLQAAALTAALVDGCEGAIGAMLGDAAVFTKAKLFRDLAALGVEQGRLPAELAISITAAGEPDDRMSFLTHGMVRHGREELFVTCPVHGRGAFDFVLGMTRWLYGDPDKHLPTGDTVGRTPSEKIVVQRVPNPTGEGPEVIRLDLER
jgi:hypothetical protein